MRRHVLTITSVCVITALGSAQTEQEREYLLGKGRHRPELNPEPSWDANQRIVVGGCFQNSKIAARVAVRRPTERIQMTNAAGFRPVATPRVGIDIATSIEQVQYTETWRPTPARS